MAYTIAVAGKGGVGKTTISSILIRLLLKIDSPILAVDADPNSNLDIALGLSYDETIADIREEARSLESKGLSKSDFFNLKIEEAVSEGKGVDLLVMGRPEGSGCYCAVNNMLRDYLVRLGKNYRFIIIDNEAGMEHLSRRTANEIDLLLLVSDTTKVGLDSAIHAFNTARSAGLKVKDISLIVNKAKALLEESKLKLIKDSGLALDGYFSYNESIAIDSEQGIEVKPTEDAEGLSKIIDKISKKAGV
ncbi:MAG: AAA family ATPase [Candidatus Omnitrophota bacterium]